MTKLGNEVYLKVFQAGVHLVVEVFIPAEELNLKSKSISDTSSFLHLAPDEEI